MHWAHLSVLSLSVTLLGACSKEEAAPAAPAEEAPAAAEAKAEAKPGEIPYDFPAVSTSAKAGQFVLAPSRDFLDKDLAGDSSSYIYYGAEMLEPGDVESKVKSLAGTEFTIPNSLIIPIEGGQAKKGDVLLGHWESGSGLQRAMVVGGTPTEPTVRYLDIALDNPSEWGTKEDTFKEGRFHPLTAAGQIGTTVACEQEDSEDRAHGILVAAEGDRVLVLGFAGKLSAMDKGQCANLAPVAQVKKGDDVYVPAVGKYVAGKVSKLESGIGRVYVSYEWGGSEKEEGFSTADVTAEFKVSASSAEPAKDSKSKGKAGKNGSRQDKVRSKIKAKSKGGN